ncbi:MAG: AraC family transcriptional regulator [Planctomycetes bacterium]|nr:AraC family transcriptional regulator [Planctomycetota bacterium]
MKPSTAQTYKERILKALVHIQGHLDEALHLEELAGVACFSPYHFHRVFGGMVGESVKEHVRRLRLERAAHRLKFTDQPVTRIAFDAGYETHEAFTRAFRAMFDASPSEFRKLHRALPLPDSPSGVHFEPEGSVTEFTPREQGETQMKVHIETVESMRVAFMRHVGPYDEVGETWQKFMAWAGGRGLLVPTMKSLALVHDDPEVTPPDKVRYDACLVVAENVQPEGEIGCQEVLGGDYAVTTHRGPYTGLGETYRRLCGQWLPTSGREPRSAPAMEFYCNNPMNTPPDELITNICLPLEDR